MSEGPMETQATQTRAPRTAREVEGAAEKPFGAAAAVTLAAGLGAFVLGVLTTLAVVSESLNDFLRFDDGVGPLSGKTIIGGGAFFALWGILHALWRAKNPPWKPVVLLAGLFLLLGLVGTFPTFFESFE